MLYLWGSNKSLVAISDKAYHPENGQVGNWIPPTSINIPETAGNPYLFFSVKFVVWLVWKYNLFREIDSIVKKTYHWRLSFSNSGKVGCLIFTLIMSSSGISKYTGSPSKPDITKGNMSNRPPLPFQPRVSQNC